MMNERREASKGNVQLSWTLGETVEEVVCESNEVKHQPRKRVNVALGSVGEGVILLI